MATLGDPQAPEVGNHAEVNGLNLYHELHGSGRPLILLHGGFGTTEMFARVLQMFAEGRRIIAVDLAASREGVRSSDGEPGTTFRLG